MIINTVKILLIVLAAVSAILWGAAGYAFNFAIKRPKKKKPETEEIYLIRQEIRKANNQRLYDLNPEDLTIKSVDGLNMKAWYLPAEKETKRFIICVHGYNCNGPDEFSHMMPFYHYDMGYNYLLPDLTAHGRSEGKYIGFGTFDSKNILRWVDYLIDRFGEDIEIILHGISMGAATVMICNELDPPDQVKLIIEDCGYGCAYDQMCDTLKKMLGFDFKLLVNMASVICKKVAGYNFKDADPLGHMDKAKNPILFIHGESDDFVPTKFGKELYEACTVDKDFLWVPDTIHAYSYYNAKDEYEAKVKSFIAKHLDKQPVEA